MPNTGSAKKRLRQSVKRRARNDVRKNAIRHWRREMMRLVVGGQHDEAEKLMPRYQAAVDKAAQRGVLHPNRAARLKARMNKRVSRAPQE